jgi:hypothetical protein
MLKIVQCALGVGLLCAATAQASTTVIDFNSDPTALGITLSPTSVAWVPYSGLAYDVNTNASDGYLQITPAVNGLSGTVTFPDFDNGSVVQGFTFDCWVRIGNGTGSATPADGFSINYVRAGAPLAWNLGGPEDGATSGIGIGFDTYQNDANNPAGMYIYVDGVQALKFPMPTINGSVTDATSLETGPNDGSGAPESLGWAHLQVILSTNGLLNVFYKNTHILTDYATGFKPGPGNLVLAGRTGGLNANQDVDQITITTVLASLAQFALTATGFSDGVSIQVFDSGPSVVDITKPMTFSLNGGPAVAATSAQKTGGTTTIAFHEFPTLLPVGSTNQIVVTVHDTRDVAITATRTFVVPNYNVLLPAWAIASGVNTTLPGFRLLPWQSPDTAGVGEPNASYWVQEQLMGLRGANNADLSSATDGGYIDYNGIINFNVWTASGQNGDFQTSNGYTDSVFPGIAGANGLTGSTALEVLTFLKFSKAGVYRMGVNSDDGFVVTAGTNPRDRLAPVLGEYSGGRGSTDTTFDVPVTSPGIYAVRLIWENGAGEGTGNGANLEWFVVDTNGVKILINDPSSTNDTGVAAYYSGPVLPAFVSQINPYIGTGSALPHKVVVQLTDGLTTVNGSSIKLGVDGSTTPAAVVSKAGTVTTAALNLFNQPLTSGPHIATLVWADSAGTTHSNNWPFTVESYAVADSGLSVPVTGVDTTQPGFAMHVTQLDPTLVGDGGDSTPNQADWANAMLAGTCYPWYGSNVADTVTVPSVSGNLWYWIDAIDFNDVTSGGDFGYDFLTPGIPGLPNPAGGSTPTYWWAKGMDGWVVFPQAGYYRMSISSDDGFRVSPGIGLLRQVLHIKGAKVDRDVAAVVSDTMYGNGGIGTPPPIVPITAPVVFLSTNNYAPGQATNLTGKIAAIDGGLYGVSDALLCYIAQTNGALAVIDVCNPANGLPYVMTGSAPAPITIPTIMVNGFGGERNTWITNTDLTATIGASQNQIWGSADYGKGMGRIDFPVIITAAGAYPIHLTYFQGNGGAGMEWQTYQGYDGLVLGSTNMVIINDTANPSSLVAYRTVKTLPTPTLSVGKQGTSYVITYTGVLRSSSTVNGSYLPVSGASSPYTIPTSSAPKMFYRAYTN